MNVILGQQVRNPRARQVSGRVTVDLDDLSLHMSTKEAGDLAAALLNALVGPFDDPISFEQLPLALRMLAHPFTGVQGIRPAERQAILDAALTIDAQLEDEAGQ